MKAKAKVSPTWYAVRCVFAHTGKRIVTYEERITIWKTTSADRAIKLAEKEASSYARALSRSVGDSACRYLGFADSYDTSLRRIVPGDEVFSLMRDSRLDGQRYLDRFFDTGSERAIEVKTRRKTKC
jgi:hypothetical protein